MRIVIDMQGAQSESRFRGIGRYSLSLSLAIARNAGEHEIWLAVSTAFPDSIPDIRHAFIGLVPPERIRVFSVPTPVVESCPANAWRARAAELIREHFLQQLQPDIVLLSSLFEGYTDNATTSVGGFSNNVSTAVVLYDLIPFLNPAVYLPTPAHKQYYDRKIYSLKNADIVLSISDYTRQEAVDTLGLAPNSVTNISTAVGARFLPKNISPEEVLLLRQRYGFTKKLVMYAPGGFDPRKNFDGLLNAYALLPAAVRVKHQLVIVSKIGEETRAQLQCWREQAGLSERELVLTDYMPDDDLVALYNLAALLVFPSKHEGFGLPVLEAMACGVPVIGSNTTSIPEVIGWDEALFDPASPRAIADKMLLFLTDDDLRKKAREHGLKQAKTFSWDTSAKRAIAAFDAWQSSPSFSTRNLSEGVHSREEYSRLLASLAQLNTLHKASDTDLALAANAIAFNTSSNRPKQLLLDISVIVRGDAKSGIQRVVRSILLELLKNPPDGYDVKPIFFDAQRYWYANFFTSTLANGFPKSNIDKDEAAEFNQDDIYLALDLNAHIVTAVHSLHMRLRCLGVRMYFVVYDILLVEHPNWWPKGTSAVFEAWLHAIAQSATGLLCISKTVADEVQEWLAENPPNRRDCPTVSHFHLGADVANSLPTTGMPGTAAAVLKALNSKPSFLMIATIEPRKGHAQTLAALEQLWVQGADINLVIVGKRGWLVDALVHKLLHHPELNKRLFWLEGISDEYLEKVYAASICLIAASEAEGFGLPLIEAAQHKLPIIARDIPVFREVAGEHVFYFSGLEPDALAESVKNWLIQDRQDQIVRASNMPCITWAESASQLKNIVCKNILTNI